MMRSAFIPTFVMLALVARSQNTIQDIDPADARWSFDGAGTWEVVDDMLHITTNTITREPYSRPSALAIFDMEMRSRCEITADVRLTATPDEARADINLIYGYQSPSRFYYAHLTGMVDEIHNGIFLVNDQDRTRIDKPGEHAAITDRKWHRVKLTWDGRSGEATVYVDDMEEPILTVIDKTFRYGKFGLGSFNDTGAFKNISIAYE